MKHRGDQTLINLLNNIRVGVITDCEKQLLKSKFIDETDVSYPYDAIYIWGGNQPVFRTQSKGA